MNKQSAISPQPSALDLLLEEPPKDSDEMDLANHYILYREKAAAELADMKLVIEQLQQALHVRDAELQRRSAIEAAAREVVGSHGIRHDEVPKPYYKVNADMLDLLTAALKESES